MKRENRAFRGLRFKGASVAAALAAVLLTVSPTGCSRNTPPDASLYSDHKISAEGAASGSETAPAILGLRYDASARGFDFSTEINVISYAPGSDTADAFTALLASGANAIASDANAFASDAITSDANAIAFGSAIKAKTIVETVEGMLTEVAGDPYSIGYVSLAALDGAVKTLDIDGIPASAANAENGTYRLIRPLVAVIKGEPDGLIKDFVDYMASTDARKIIIDNGYIPGGALFSEKPVTRLSSADGSAAPGNLIVAGSSSFAPLMEKFRDGFMDQNADTLIEIQTRGMSPGADSVAGGACDIGIAGRRLSESETAGLTPMIVAADVIAVIVNIHNPFIYLPEDAVSDVFNGDAVCWDEVTRPAVAGAASSR